MPFFIILCRCRFMRLIIIDYLIFTVAALLIIDTLNITAACLFIIYALITIIICHFRRLIIVYYSHDAIDV